MGIAKETEAIELGKVWMRKSSSARHNYEHARRVTLHALKIFDELAQKEPDLVNDIDTTLIKLTTWWHDCYKSTKPYTNINDLFTEGQKSAAIFKKEMESFLDDDRIKRIAGVISKHHLATTHFWKLKKVDPLLRILFEADGLDVIRKDRFWTGLMKNKNNFKKIIDFILYRFSIIFYFFYPKTDYGKMAYKRIRQQKFLKTK